MGYYCKASSDCSCTLWNNGNICDTCIEEDCLSLVQTYDFRKCECMIEDKPILYGTGTAKRYMEYKNDYQPICWNDFEGYVVECQGCNSITEHFNTPDEAVEAWNNHKLKYDGNKWRKNISEMT